MIEAEWSSEVTKYLRLDYQANKSGNSGHATNCNNHGRKVVLNISFIHVILNQTEQKVLIVKQR